MKTLLFILLLSLIGSANTQVKVDSSTPLRTYNHKPSIKLKKQRELRTLAKVKREEAYHIARSLSGQNVKTYKLTHKGQLLFYRLYTKDFRIEINALDGAIISKVLL